MWNPSFSSVRLAALLALVANCSASLRRVGPGDNDTIAQLVEQGLLRVSTRGVTKPQVSTTLKDPSPVPRTRNDSLENSVWGSNIRPRVIDGVPDDGKYPFVVSFQIVWDEKLAESFPEVSFIPKGLFRSCSGSLITETWVLSAGHCASAGRIVRYGDMAEPLNVTKNKRIALKAIHHPSYKVTMNGACLNDIALLLVEKIPVRPGRLSAVEPEAMLGHAVRYAGFGGTFHWEKSVKDFSRLYTLDRKKPLQIGEALVNRCSKGEMDENHNGYVICLVPKCSKRTNIAYYGDSGGPLLYDGRIAGVAKSVDFGLNRFYYTPVAPYLDWIKAVIKGDSQATA